MKFSQLEFAILGLVFGAGVFYILKTRSVSNEFQNAYNVLAGEISTGKLVMAQPSGNPIK
jgi:hypothetical protein